MAPSFSDSYSCKEPGPFTFYYALKINGLVFNSIFSYTPWHWYKQPVFIQYWWLTSFEGRVDIISMTESALVINFVINSLSMHRYRNNEWLFKISHLFTKGNAITWYYYHTPHYSIILKEHAGNSYTSIHKSTKIMSALLISVVQ